MIRVAVAGMNSREVARLAGQAGGGAVEVVETSDLAAARLVQEGKADYLLGSCSTGAGGSLAMAIAVLGRTRCATVSTAGRPPRAEDVAKAVKEGKVAFGFTTDHAGVAVPMIVRAILAERGGEAVDHWDAEGRCISCWRHPPSSR